MSPTKRQRHWKETWRELRSYIVAGWTKV